MKIDSAAQLAAIIRTQLGAARRFQNPSRQSEASDIALSEEQESSFLTPSEGTILSLIAHRVRSIDKNDAQRQRKAFKIFLESVLLQELGVHLLGDAGFQKLLDQVQQHMESDEELKAVMQQASSLYSKGRSKMDSIEMESHENKLIGLLHSCEELLKQIGESFWSNKIHLIIQTKNGKLDSNKVDTILSWYGGMGSFNDLLVSRYNGHSVKSEDEDSLMIDYMELEVPYMKKLIN